MIESAQYQTGSAPWNSLQSSNAGVVVEVVAQLKNGYRNEALRLLHETASYINEVKKDRVTMLSFQELGTLGHLHVLLHLSSLNDYDELCEMATRDDLFCKILEQNALPASKGGAAWDTMFIDGSIKATVMLPQFRGMYGAAAAVVEVKPSQPLIGLPAAYHQFTFPLNEIIHSANAGLMLHRSAQLKYEFRSEGRQFARDVVDSINSKARGEATCFLYEDAFGASDTLHWLIHMKDIGSYYPLIKLHATDPEVRELYFRETLPLEKGGGNWSRMFVEGSMFDFAFSPIQFKRNV